MKTYMKISVCLLLALMVSSAFAQSFRGVSSTPFSGDQAKTMESIRNQSAYSSTIYAPFSNDVPSSGAVTTYDDDEEYNEQSAHSARRRVLGGNADPGEGPHMSPLGDPVWPMLAFALMAMGVIAVRRMYSYGEKK